jgi:uncharacterized membrane protein
MPAGWRRLLGGVSIVLLFGVPFLIYRVLAAPPAFTSAVAIGQITAAVWWFTSRWTFFYRAALVVSLLALGTVVMMLSGLSAHVLGLLAAGGCHAAAYVCLLIWFGFSLRLGHEPAITGFARRIRQTMPETVVRYTRQVTIAWCIFFAAQLLVSVLLLLLAPLTVWRDFVSVLNLPLVAVMMLAEFGYRQIRFRYEPHTSLFDTLSALRGVRFNPPAQP